MVQKLVSIISGRTLILVERIEHGDMLSDLIPQASWVKGEDNSSTRKLVIDQLKHSESAVGIATSGIFNTGLNVFVHNLVNCASGQAEHMIVQRMGRGLRTAKDKEICNYYDFLFHNNEYLYKHSMKRIKILQKEGHEVEIKEFDLWAKEN
jgi:superfamily II DNA or RNA helicase